MYSFQKINNVDFEPKLSFSSFFLKKNHGTATFFLDKLEARFEHFSKLPIAELEPEQILALLSLLSKIFPRNLFFSNQTLVNVIFLDFSYSYRG